MFCLEFHTVLQRNWHLTQLCPFLNQDNSDMDFMISYLKVIKLWPFLSKEITFKQSTSQLQEYMLFILHRYVTSLITSFMTLTIIINLRHLFKINNISEKTNMLARTERIDILNFFKLVNILCYECTKNVYEGLSGNI